MGEITLHLAQIVNTKQLQHSIPSKHGLFQVYIIVNNQHKYDNKEEADDDDNNILTFLYNTMHRSFCGLLSYFLPLTHGKLYNSCKCLISIDIP